MYQVETIYSGYIVGDFPTITAQQKGITKTGKVYTKPEVKAARNWLTLQIKQSLDYTIREAGSGIYAVSIAFGYSVKDKKLWGEFKPTRPDVDNQAKLILDVMTDLNFWKDDSQVVNLELLKYYSEKSFIKIHVMEITKTEGETL